MKDKQKHYRSWAVEIIRSSDNLIYLNYLSKYWKEFNLFNGLKPRDRDRLKRSLDYKIYKIKEKSLD